jgi:hypothetical protein
MFANLSNVLSKQLIYSDSSDDIMVHFATAPLIDFEYPSWQGVVVLSVTDARDHVVSMYTHSKMKPGFQIAAEAYSSCVTRAMWKGLWSRFHFGMGIADATS